MEAISEITSATQLMDLLLDLYVPGTAVVYIAYIGTIDGEVIIKYGSTKTLKTRINTHKIDYKTFKLVCFVEYDDHRELESSFEDHPQISEHRRVHKINGRNRKEHVALNDALSLKQCLQILKQIKIELSTVKAEQQKIIELNSRYDLLSAEVTDLQHKLIVEKQNHQTSSKLLKLTHEQSSSSIDLEYKQSLSTLNWNYKQSLAKLDSDHEQSLMKLNSDHEQGIVRLNSDHETLCNELNYQMQCKSTELQRVGCLKEAQEAKEAKEKEAKEAEAKEAKEAKAKEKEAEELKKSNKSEEQQIIDFINKYYEQVPDSRMYVTYEDLSTHYKKLTPNGSQRPKLTKVLSTMGVQVDKNCGKKGKKCGQLGFRYMKRR